MPGESIQEEECFVAVIPISVTDLVPTDPYLFVCEVTGEGP